MNAYFWWRKGAHPKLRKYLQKKYHSPLVQNVDMNRILSQQWRKLKDEYPERHAKYQRMADLDKKRFNKEYREWYRTRLSKVVD